MVIFCKTYLTVTRWLAGGAYVVAGFGLDPFESRLTAARVAQLFSLALALHSVTDCFAVASASGSPDASGGAVIRNRTGWRVRLRVGVALGTVAAGVVGTPRCLLRLLGPGLSDAAALALCAAPGETAVQRSLAKAASAAFMFSPAGAAPPIGDPGEYLWRERVLLRGRRALPPGHWGEDHIGAAVGAETPVSSRQLQLPSEFCTREDDTAWWEA